MKLTVFFMLVVVLHTTASGISQTITFSANEMPLEKVINILKKQTGYVFLYKPSLMKESHKVTIHAKDLEVNEFFHRLFKDQPITYSIENQSVVLSKRTITPEVVEEPFEIKILPITGTLKDRDGTPISGVNITIKGKTIGQVSDGNGQFSLNATVGDVLVISAVGFQTREVRITNNAPLLIVLEKQISDLGEMIVTFNTGIQALPKDRSAGSFAKPDMKTMSNRSSTMNVVSRLDGLVPGLALNFSPDAMIVTTGNLANGVVQTDNSILIRGLSSLYSRRGPLFVVDGIAIDDINSINPQDVADITVLKDATAASIWGARAANGVIVITTKRGGKSEKLTVTYDAFVNMQPAPDLKYHKMLSSSQFVRAAREIFDPVTYNYGVITKGNTANLFTNGGIQIAIQPHEQILYDEYRGLISASVAQAKLDSLARIDNSEQYADYFTRRGLLMNHTLSVSGGGNVHSFYGSLAYTDTRDNTPGNKNQQFKINLRQDFRISEGIRFFLISDLTSTNTASKRPFPLRRDQSYSKLLPYQLLVDENGNSLSMPYLVTVSDSLRREVENKTKIDLSYKPVDEFNYGSTDTKRTLARLTAGLNVKLYKGLAYESIVGYVRGSYRTNMLDSKESYKVRQEMAGYTTYNPLSGAPIYYLSENFMPGAQLTLRNNQQTEWTIRNQLTYNSAWKNNRHQVSLVAGQEAKKAWTFLDENTIRGYNEQMQSGAVLNYINLIVPIASATTQYAVPAITADYFIQSSTDDRFTSYYATGGYTFDNKYSLNGSWRIDRSNLFGKDKSAQDRPVWSVGAKWDLWKEDFLNFPLSKIGIDELAIRTTYGITGNSPAPGTVASSDIVGASNTTDYLGGVRYSISTVANRKLTWELTNNLNIGLDLSMLRNRVNASIDYYSKKTTGALGQVPGNTMTGYTTYLGNYGDLYNKGVELGLNVRVVDNPTFLWAVNFNMAYNKSKITELAGGFTSASLVSSTFVLGYAPMALFAYNFVGLDDLGDPQIQLSDGTITKNPNIRSTLTVEDLLYMGTTIPVWKGGFNNSFQYKNFGLNATIVYNLGHVMRTNPNGLYTDRLVVNQPEEFDRRWKKPGDEAFTNVPSYVSNSSLNTSRRSTNYYTNSQLNVASASFIKMRDITFTYSLAKAIAQRLSMSSIEFRAQLSNVMLWKANKAGLDPEFQDLYYGNRGNNAGKNPYISNSQYVIPTGQATVTLGVHVIF